MIAAFKEDWKRKRQQGTMSKFKATSVNRNKKSSREPMKCWNCNKPGHRMADCPDVNHKPRSKGSSSYDSNDRSYVKSKSSMNNINANVNDNKDEANFHGLTRTIINKNSTITLIDTGAGRSALALSAYQPNLHGRLFTKDWRKPKLSQLCGDKISIVGSVLVKWKMGDTVKAHKLWVVRNMALDAIMGWDALREFGAMIDCNKMVVTIQGVEISLHGPLTRREMEQVAENVAAQSERLLRLKWQLELIRAQEEEERRKAASNMTDYNVQVEAQEEDPRPTIGEDLTPEQRRVANDLWDSVKDDISATKDRSFGKATGVEEAVLRLKSDAKPFSYRPFRLDDAKTEEVSRQLIKWLERDVVEQSRSQYTSNIFPTPKPDGTFRMAFDGRPINRIIENDNLVTPLFQDCIRDMKGCKYFSSLDLREFFLQLIVHVDSRNFLSFQVREGTYRFKRMPYGVKTASAHAQRVMITLMRGIPGLRVYIDDMVIYTKTFDEHVRVLREVFRRLKEAGLLLKTKKCCLFMRSLKFLGFVVSADGYRVDTERAEIIDQLQVDDLKSLRTFIGVAEFVRPVDSKLC